MISLFPSRTVAIELFGFAIHWYGLLYLAAFLLAWLLAPRLQKYRGLSLSSDDWSGLLSAAVIGVIVGGRLGFVLFYEAQYFFNNPAEIIAVWHGGMSSHGGFIGVALALFYALRKSSTTQRLKIADVVVVPIALGLFCGRLGNFINQELYGTATTLPWGIAIPGLDGLRHPTQAYAMLKDLLIAGVCFWHLKNVQAKPGQTCALFLVLYGILRTVVEFFRVQEYTGLSLGFWDVTRGQLLTVPVILVGIVLWMWAKKRAA